MSDKRKKLNLEQLKSRPWYLERFRIRCACDHESSSGTKVADNFARVNELVHSVINGFDLDHRFVELKITVSEWSYSVELRSTVNPKAWMRMGFPAETTIETVDYVSVLHQRRKKIYSASCGEMEPDDQRNAETALWYELANYLDPILRLLAQGRGKKMFKEAQRLGMNELCDYDVDPEEPDFHAL
jgi:hypothetical protein